MAIFSIFADRSATIYAENPETNTGRDQILEIGVEQNVVANSDFAGGLAINRALVGFDTNDLTEAIALTTGSYVAELALFLADADGAVSEATFEVFPVYESWEEGTGIEADRPQNKTGVSWTFRDYPADLEWATGSFPPITSLPWVAVVPDTSTRFPFFVARLNPAKSSQMVPLSTLLRSPSNSMTL